MDVKISIIIPCYNSEETLEATLNSVIKQEFKDWEAIIVNDGSIDSTEEIALKWLKIDSRFKYYSKQNEGLGKTRNYGISKASGKYILPLDSDNQLCNSFISDAIEVFRHNSNFGVVYGNAEYFGEKKGIWEVEEYKLEKILVHNYIDACAIYKKELWCQVGGYDEEMPYQGHEDWEFWIALGYINVNFYHLDKITFKYFVSKKSMIRSFTTEMVMSNQDYIVKKYSKLYHDYFCKVIDKCDEVEHKIFKKLKSKKIVLDLFCKTFFGFTIFRSNLKSFD